MFMEALQEKTENSVTGERGHCPLEVRGNSLEDDVYSETSRILKKSRGKSIPG